VVDDTSSDLLMVLPFAWLFKAGWYREGLWRGTALLLAWHSERGRLARRRSEIGEIRSEATATYPFDKVG
jgi:hypothetical protein